MLGIAAQSLKMSLQNIKSNKMRSFLTMLGIIIGVASVIALITIVSGATDSIMGKFDSLGTGSISLSAPGTSIKKGLSENDLETLSNVEGVAGIAPSVSMTASSVVNNTVYKKTSLSGESAVYFLNNDLIEEGRGLTPADMNGDSFVCIVDHDYIDKAMWGMKILGSKIRINGYEYTVVGIQKKSDSLFDQLMDNSDKDGGIIIPYKNALRMSGAANISSATVYPDDDADSTKVQENLRIALKNIYNNADNAYSVYTMESLMDMMNEIKSMMQTMLGGIASIALLVGGIGIMNMMLVSVSERTKEIGLRKALGAEPVRIQMQFLIESVVLSITGGIIGVVIGELIAFVAAKLINISYVPDLSAVLLGLGFSIAVGVIFGWAPARRASKLNPIDALRSE